MAPAAVAFAFAFATLAVAWFAACSSSRNDAVGPPAKNDATAIGEPTDGATPSTVDAEPLGEGGEASDARTSNGDAASDASAAADVDTGPCTTRITYGAAWIAPANHPASFDDAPGVVTWDGTCTTSAGNSSATLSNGYQPYFTGQDACILALDRRGNCGSAPPSCSTRVTYGAAWVPPANHPTSYDDVEGRVFSDGVCHASGSGSYAALSNGWQPTFSSKSACGLSFEYTQCGGLYDNPVIPLDCPDPGVLLDEGTYYLSCTSGDAADAFPIYTSPDLVTWSPAGHIFPSARKPTWGTSDYWAPEIHRVGSAYVAYFSARNTDGMLSIGAASAATPLGPFTDLGAPLIHDTQMGLIDASEIEADGTAYVIWKEDGNAVGKPTPIHAQSLTATGLALTGAPATLITNDPSSWEGAVTEGPWMVAHGGVYYLFYSGNAYDTSSYAVGVAQSASVLGPFTKAPAPILVTGGAWAGPGHCSVIDTPAGDTAMVYHAWESTAVGGGPGRQVLTDEVTWGASGPQVPLSPSSTSRPVP